MNEFIGDIEDGFKQVDKTVNKLFDILNGKFKKMLPI